MTFFVWLGLSILLYVIGRYQKMKDYEGHIKSLEGQVEFWKTLAEKRKNEVNLNL